MNKEKLYALINLLDDPDSAVFEIVEQELLKQGHEIIPALEESWENSFDEHCQERIENLIQSLQFRKTKNLIKNWLSLSEPDLLNGMILVNRFQYPDLNLLGIHQKIENLRKEIWLEFNNSLTMLEKLTILNHFLFNINGYGINHQNINSPQNCFLNQILDSKNGNSTSISILYTILARMLDLPAFFVDFPRNPLVAIADEKMAKKVHGSSRKTNVVFYINPSNKGAVTSRKEVEYHLRKNKYFPLRSFSEPKSDILYIKRLLESLSESYQSVGFKENEDKIKELIRLF